MNTQDYKQKLEEVKFRTQAYIAGEYVDAKSGKTFKSINPANGKVIVSIAAGDVADIDKAVGSARETFEAGTWSQMDPSERKKILLNLANLIDENSEELALLDALEAGKPISDCLSIDLPETIDCFSWHGEVTDKLYDQVAPSGKNSVAMVVREPIGVVGAVVPWNFPLLMAAWKLGPALAMGNSVVLKPAEQSSLSALRLAELAVQAGLPEGVLNVVPGLGEEAGEALGRHMDVDMVTFTGSTEVGRYFLKYAAESNLKRIVLECGGKSPQIVMSDVSDLDAVADHALDAVFWNMGENCSSGSRLVVHKDVKEELLSKIVAKSADWIVGDPMDPEIKVGAMIEKEHMDKVLGYIEKGKKEGAQLVLGGRQVNMESGGYFVEPTIFDGVTNDMIIAQEEIFGPVLSVITFETEEEAIQIANDSIYGLAA
jgi:gamma-glutamyl-gamma-aminobutyraldehyde dehydrogenase